MKSVVDLDVFKLAHQLALKTYSTTKTFPRAETFSLVDQMRRAATSIGMNLMEGAMRLGTKEYRQFVGIARGSAGEVCYQLLLARDLRIHLQRNVSGVAGRGRTRHPNALPSLTKSQSLARVTITSHEHVFSPTITALVPSTPTSLLMPEHEPRTRARSWPRPPHPACLLPEQTLLIYIESRRCGRPPELLCRASRYERAPET